MIIDQADIKINDFLLRIKDDGDWIRLDIDFMQEADDYHLDFTKKDDVIALCILRDEFPKEYEYIREKLKTKMAYEINLKDMKK